MALKAVIVYCYTVIQHEKDEKYIQTKTNTNVKVLSSLSRELFNEFHTNSWPSPLREVQNVWSNDNGPFLRA